MMIIPLESLLFSKSYLEDVRCFLPCIEKHSKHTTEAISIVTDRELMNKINGRQIAQDRLAFLGQSFH